MLYLFAGQVAVTASIAAWLAILFLWRSGADWSRRGGEEQDEETDFGLYGAEETPLLEEATPLGEEEEDGEETTEDEGIARDEEETTTKDEGIAKDEEETIKGVAKGGEEKTKDKRSGCYPELAEDRMIPLNPVEAKPRRLAKGLLVDTGAGVTIANGADSFPEYPLEPSVGSKSGQEYAGPGEKDIIKNRGQRNIKLRLGSAGGQLAAVRFQDAAVRRPILSVGESTEAGNMYVFDKQGSMILLSGCPEIEEIRRIMGRATMKIGMSKDRNTYQVEAFVEPPHHKNEVPFVR